MLSDLDYRIQKVRKRNPAAEPAKKVTMTSGPRIKIIGPVSEVL